MIIRDFYPKTFQDIPEPNNPAFGSEECVMIVKDFKTTHFVILHILPDPEESVNHIAIFWKHKHAIEYANFFIKEEKEK